MPSILSHHRQYTALIDRLTTVLNKAAAQRHMAGNAISASGELVWVERQRKAIRAECDQVRKELGLPPVSDEAFSRAENLAVGHSDFSHKFALYCAEDVRHDLENAMNSLGRMCLVSGHGLHE